MTQPKPIPAGFVPMSVHRNYVQSTEREQRRIALQLAVDAGGRMGLRNGAVGLVELAEAFDKFLKGAPKQKARR